MLYADGLEERDLRNFGIGEIVTGAFYRRATSLESQVRGINEDLWWRAVGDLKHSLSLNGKLAASSASLGVAYLLRPVGPDAGTSAQYLEKAYQSANEDASLDPMSKVTLLLNLGVAAAAGGDAKRAENAFAEARTKFEALSRSSDLEPRIARAILYNESRRLATSSARADQEQAVTQFQNYLRASSPESPWWNLAYEEYSQLARKLQLEPARKDSLTRTVIRHYRPVTALKLAKGEIQLGQPLRRVQDLLGNGLVAPAIPSTNLVIVRYPSESLELIANDRVLAIVVTTARHPIPLMETGLGAKQVSLSVGMTTAAIQELLHDSTVGPLLANDQLCLFYPDEGIAYQPDAFNSHVAKLILVQVPE